MDIIICAHILHLDVVGVCPGFTQHCVPPADSYLDDYSKNVRLMDNNPLHTHEDVNLAFLR